MNTKTVVILAAGSSSRFHPFNVSHKALVTVSGETVFKRTLNALKQAGMKNIIVVQNETNELFDSLSLDEAKINNVTFVTQKDATGMGDALLLAEKLISENNFFVISPYHFEFSQFCEEMKNAAKKETDIVILTKQDNDMSQFGGVGLENGKVKVYEKQESGKFESRIISIYLLNKEFLKILGDAEKHHYSFEDAISNYRAGEIVLLDTKLQTISLKFPWDLLAVKDYILQDVKSYVSPDATVSNSAKITGDVYISRNVKIMDGAVIAGPAYIGENSYIGTNSILRNGVIVEKNAVVGAGMELKNSIIMEGTTTHSGFIGDSVVSKNVKIAAGFITGNVRLDRREIAAIVKNEKINTHKKFLGTFIGADTSVGIHVGTMPGIIIGNNIVIGPGTTVMENVPDNCSYYTEFKSIVLKKN